MGQQEGTSTADSLRWALLTCLLAAVVGVVCYWVGLVNGEEPTARAEHRTPARHATAPGLVPLDEVYDAAQGDVERTRDRAYLRGRLAGKREGRREASRRYARGGDDWRRIFDAGRSSLLGPGRPDGWYAITVGKNGASTTSRLEPGRRYEVCRDGRALCATDD